jgi:acetylornithine deacetylase/succinyl-diaminopimelate desuccinylase-like protein
MDDAAATSAISWETPHFCARARAAQCVAGIRSVVAPSGGTDARHYAVLTPNLYRFLPVTLTPELLASFHGNNERIPIDEYVRMVRFYLLLLQPDGAVDPQRQS